MLRSTRHPASRTPGSRRWLDREVATRRDSKLVPRRVRPCRSGRPTPPRPARERRSTTPVAPRPPSTTVGAAPDRGNPRNRDPPASVALHRPPDASADASRRRSIRSRRTTWRHRGRSGPTKPTPSHSYRALFPVRDLRKPGPMPAASSSTQAGLRSLCRPGNRPSPRRCVPCITTPVVRVRRREEHGCRQGVRPYEDS